MLTLSIDIGGTKIAGALFNKDGVILHQTKQLIYKRKGKEVGDLVLELISEMKRLAQQSEVRIQGIGVCIPGIVYSKTGKVWAPNIAGWEEYPLLDQIQDFINDPAIPVRIESDRTCHMLGEVWKGAAQACDNALFIAVGTGIGVGMVIDGRLVHGHSDIVGAAGWMALQAPYSSDYDACGCFETYASGNGIGAQAREMLRKNTDYQGAMRTKPVEEISAYDVFAHYASGDAIAIAVLRKAIEYWGMASANLVSLLNPEKVIWGGGIFGPATPLIPNIYQEALRWGQPISMRQVSFLGSQIEEAGLVGAAYLAFRGDM